MNTISKLLKRGDVGEEVAQLQQFLTTIMHDGRPLYEGTVNLEYEARTEQGVRHLQQQLIDRGLLEISAPTGNFGPMTQEAWDKAPDTVKEGIKAGNSAAAKNNGAVLSPNGDFVLPPELTVVERVLDRSPVAIPSLPLNIYQNPQDRTRDMQRQHREIFKPAPEEPISPLLVQAALTSDFGMRLHPIKHVQKMHDGVDLDVFGNDREDRRLVAPESGYMVVDRKDDNAMGRNITIYADSGNRWKMYHLDSVTSNLETGSRVTQGQSVGMMGNTGGSTGEHLHLILEQPNATGKFVAVDPLLVLGDNIQGSGKARQMRADITAPQAPQTHAPQLAQLPLTPQTISALSASIILETPPAAGISSEIEMPKNPGLAYAAENLQPVAPTRIESATMELASRITITR